MPFRGQNDSREVGLSLFWRDHFAKMQPFWAHRFEGDFVNSRGEHLGKTPIELVKHSIPRNSDSGVILPILEGAFHQIIP